MRRFSLYASTALGVGIGGILFNAKPAYADLPTIDFGAISQAIQSNSTLTAMKTVLTTVSSTMNDVKTFANGILGSLGDNTFGTVQSLLQQGFTQNANYSKATINANADIADASNAAMAGFQTQIRQVQIRDEHTVSPEACAALDGGVSTNAAGVQGFGIAWTIGRIHSARGRADLGMPSYYGEAQGVASMSKQHIGRYCDQKDVDAGLCATPATIPDADSDVGSLFGGGTYADQAAVDAAKDYATNLIQPIAPAALRGAQLSSVEGQDAAVRRRSYDARMSLAYSVVDEQIGMRAPSVPITAAQTAYLTSVGLPAPTSGNISWLTALQIEAERRASGVSWAATLQNAPPATVSREVALELAMTNFLLFQNLKQGQKQSALLSAILAETVDRNYTPSARLPIPNVN